MLLLYLIIIASIVYFKVNEAQLMPFTSTDPYTTIINYFLSIKFKFVLV